MPVENSHIPGFRRGYRLQWEPAQQCHVVLYPEGMAKLNESAAAILQQIDGKLSVTELIAALNAAFPEAGGVDDDVKEFLVEAVEQKWIILHEPA